DNSNWADDAGSGVRPGRGSQRRWHGESGTTRRGRQYDASATAVGGDGSADGARIGGGQLARLVGSGSDCGEGLGANIAVSCLSRGLERRPVRKARTSGSVENQSRWGRHRSGAGSAEDARTAGQRGCGSLVGQIPRCQRIARSVTHRVAPGDAFERQVIARPALGGRTSGG